MRGHRSCIRISQRDLLLTGGAHLCFQRRQGLQLSLQRLDASLQALDLRRRHRNAAHGMLVVSPIEFREVAVDGLLDGRHPPCEPIVRKVLLAVVHCLELAAIDGDGGGIQEAQVAAQRDELRTDLADSRTVVAAEVGDGLEVRCQAPREPDQLQVPMAFALKAARRLNLVEVAVDVDLKERRRVITRPPSLFGNDAVEAERCEIQHVDEGIDHPDRVLLADVVLNRVRQQSRLPPIRTFDEPPHPILPHNLAGIVQCFAGTVGFSHRLIQKPTFLGSVDGEAATMSRRGDTPPERS